MAKSGEKQILDETNFMFNLETNMQHEDGRYSAHGGEEHAGDGMFILSMNAIGSSITQLLSGDARVGDGQAIGGGRWATTEYAIA